MLFLKNNIVKRSTSIESGYSVKHEGPIASAISSSLIRVLTFVLITSTSVSLASQDMAASLDDDSDILVGMDEEDEALEIKLNLALVEVASFDLSDADTSKVNAKIREGLKQAGVKTTMIALPGRGEKSKKKGTRISSSSKKALEKALRDIGRAESYLKNDSTRNAALVLDRVEKSLVEHQRALLNMDTRVRFFLAKARLLMREDRRAEADAMLINALTIDPTRGLIPQQSPPIFENRLREVQNTLSADKSLGVLEIIAPQTTEIRVDGVRYGKGSKLVEGLLSGEHWVQVLPEGGDLKVEKVVVSANEKAELRIEDESPKESKAGMAILENRLDKKTLQWLVGGAKAKGSQAALASFASRSAGMTEVHYVLVRVGDGKTVSLPPLRLDNDFLNVTIEVERLRSAISSTLEGGDFIAYAGTPIHPSARSLSEKATATGPERVQGPLIAKAGAFDPSGDVVDDSRARTKPAQSVNRSESGRRLLDSPQPKTGSSESGRRLLSTGNSGQQRASMRDTFDSRESKRLSDDSPSTRVSISDESEVTRPWYKNPWTWVGVGAGVVVLGGGTGVGLWYLNQNASVSGGDVAIGSFLGS